MSSRTPTNHTATRSLPTERDLDHLSRKIRATAQKRELSERAVERYEDWIFLFIAWSLEAPPCRIRRDRIGEFWTALTQRQVGRGKVCQAMDALGFLFGTLGGPEELSFPTGGRLAKGPEMSEETGRDGGSDETDGPSTLVGESPGVIQTNPDLRDLDPEPKTLHGGTSTEDPGHYLPDGALPSGVDARQAVPTRGARQDASDDPESSTDSETSEERPSDSETSGSDRPSSPRSGRDTLTTLFNPEGTPPPPEDEDEPVEELFRKGGADDARSGAGASPGDGHPSGTKSSSSSLRDDSPAGDSSESAPSEEDVQSPEPLPNEARRLWDATAPEDEAPDPEPGAAQDPHEASEGEETVSVEIPKAVADRVQRAARRLGLPPSVFAARGLDMVCEDAGVERSDQAGPDSTIERYQAQLDLLHLEQQDSDAPDDSADASGPEAPSPSNGPRGGGEPEPTPDMGPAPSAERGGWDLSDTGSRAGSERPPEGARPPKGDSLPKDGPAGGDGWIGDVPQFDD